MFPVEPVISPIQRFVKTLNLAGLAVLPILFVVSLPEYVLTHFLSLGYVLAENQILHRTIQEQIVSGVQTAIDLVIILMLLLMRSMYAYHTTESIS